ncbi:MAG: hypothetical protein OEY61_05065 [Gammaproteobacteria bacterium]|nr:hypothetical protein [Gammaproteobacteria bacterium]
MSLSDPVKEFEGLLDKSENKDMIRFLKQHQPSAHTDIVDLLIKSVEGLPDVSFYCPDTDNHAYYIAHTSDGIMFAAAIGLSGLMFKLPKKAMSGALVKGGEVMSDISEDWVNFNPFWPEENREKYSVEDMKHWCKLAYHACK